MDLYSYEELTYLTIIDMLSRQTWILQVDNKTESEVASVFRTWFQSMGPEFQTKYSKLLSDRGGEFNFEVLGLRRIRTAAAHPQTNGTLERKHRELSQQARIHGVKPHNLPPESFSPRTITNLALRYIPKERRTKSDDPWTFVDSEALLYDNERGQTIRARTLDTGRMTTLNPDDYKMINRPDITSWRVNEGLLDEALDEFGINREILQDARWNETWKDKTIFADVGQFHDLLMFFKKAKKEKVKDMVFVIPEWKETDEWRALESIVTTMIELPNDGDVFVQHHGDPVGPLNFGTWIGSILSFADWGGV